MKTGSIHTAGKAELSAHQLEGIRSTLGRNPTPAEAEVYASLWNQAPFALGLGSHAPLACNAGQSLVVGLHTFPLGSGQPSALGIAASMASMGARPIAALSSIASPPPSGGSHPLNGAVGQLGAYIHSLGIPMVGGETFFIPDHHGSPHIQLLCLGVSDSSRLLPPASGVTGCVLCLLQAQANPSRGGDGISGAQVEHLMVEAMLEMNGLGLLQGARPLGAGGIAKAVADVLRGEGSGARVWAHRIPLDSRPPAEELITSALPLSMLLLVTTGCEEDAHSVSAKWGLTCTIIGETTRGGQLEVIAGEAVALNLPLPTLRAQPLGSRPTAAPSGQAGMAPPPLDMDSFGEPRDLKETARALVAHPNIASKRRLYEQFDSMVGGLNLGVNLSTTAAVIAMPGEGARALAISLDCTPRYIKSDPEQGATIAVAEAARNILCAGALPVGIAYSIPSSTSSPLADAVERGVARASQAMGIPVVLESVQPPVADGPALPTIGLIGVIDSIKSIKTLAFKAKGHMIYLIGRSYNDIGSSQYLESWHGVSLSPPPHFCMDQELALQAALAELARRELILSANDVSDGGLFVALLQSAMPHDLGFDITTDAEVRTDAFLFGEAQGRAVISVSEAQEGDFIDFMMERGVPFTALGHVTKSEIRVDDVSYGFIADLKGLHASALRV